MNYKVISAFLIGLFFLSFGNTQTFVGEIIYDNQYEYIKVKCTSDSIELSLPYIDGGRKYMSTGNVRNNSEWNITRKIEEWTFQTKIDDGRLVGILRNPQGEQSIELRAQNNDSTNLKPYIGIYEDEERRRVVTYERYNYLHIMSPYSKQTVSLKKIGEQAFWSVSGEFSYFKDNLNGRFSTLNVVDRFGEVKKLNRVNDIIIEEHWIPIDGDTLYAKLFMPVHDTPVPGCLVLPGGGAVEMDNYVFETRFLAANDIASMTFDKSGNGKSIGTENFERQSFEDKTAQYLKVLDYFRQLPNIDAGRVGVHGSSEGGRLALMMAIDDSRIAFVNAVAAPIMSMREGQLYAMDQHHRTLGISEKNNLAIKNIWQEYYDGILNGAIKESTISKANEFRDLNPRIFLPPNSTIIPISPKKEDLENDRVSSELKKIHCPVFLQYGENDQRVEPIKSIQNLYRNLSKEVNAYHKIYRRGNHSLMTPEHKICIGYTQDKISWLKSIGIL